METLPAEPLHVYTATVIAVLIKLQSFMIVVSRSKARTCVVDYQDDERFRT